MDRVAQSKVLVGIVLAGLLFGGVALAHPGNTASDGCHYCRTNCSKWGEVHGARHCHGGGRIAPPVWTPAPTVLPTRRPATPTPVISFPTRSPNILGDQDNKIELISDDSEEQAASDDDGSGLVFGGFLLASVVGFLVWLKR